MKTGITHKSKIGLEILIPTVVILGTVTAIMIINSIWPGLVICLLTILFIVSFYVLTYYRITPDRHLYIRCGFIESFEIKIDDIEWIKKSRNPLSAPALSIDRLEIGYKGGQILVSPLDKQKFVNDLRQINPNIWWTN